MLTQGSLFFSKSYRSVECFHVANFCLKSFTQFTKKELRCFFLLKHLTFPMYLYKLENSYLYYYYLIK